MYINKRYCALKSVLVSCYNIVLFLHSLESFALVTLKKTALKRFAGDAKISK